MKKLAAQIATEIERQLQAGEWQHCAVYENELQRIWPLDEKDREAKIAQFAKEYGFRLGLVVRFGSKSPPEADKNGGVTPRR